MPWQGTPETGCIGKVRYASRRDAKTAASLIRRGSGRKPAHATTNQNLHMRPYLCPHGCGFWHIGHLGYAQKRGFA